MTFKNSAEAAEELIRQPALILCDLYGLLFFNVFCFYIIRNVFMDGSGLEWPDDAGKAGGLTQTGP